MEKGLPVYITTVFILTTFITLFLLLAAISKSKEFHKKTGRISVFLLIWLIFQMLVASSGFYLETTSLPPRFAMVLLPPLITIIGLFATRKGRMFIDSLPLKDLTYVNTVRVPVEIVLYWLALEKQIPELMTFEGRNFDILVGITAPFIAYFGFTKQKLGKNVILFWNIFALGLLINIVYYGIFSSPFPFQKYSFDQPNIAMIRFPMVWLPCFIVPVALFTHLVSIRRLLHKS